MKKLFLIFTLLFQYSLFAQIDSAALSQYLDKNKEVIDLKGPSKIKSFDKDFYSNKLYLFGENHGSDSPHNFDLKMFKQLYKENHVRHYIAEVDASKAWMLNNYMIDGNESWLNKVFSSWIQQSAQWANQSNYNKFKELRSFYQTLDKNQKFKIIGIDVIQDYSLLKEYVTFLFKDSKNLKPSLEKMKVLIDTLSLAGRNSLGILTRTELLQLNDFSTIKKSNIQELKDLIKSFSYIGVGMYRDSIMYRNMMNFTASNHLKNAKFYGFLGFYHCLQTSYGKNIPFAALLNKHEPDYKKNIVSVQMYAIDSKVLLPYIDQVKKMMPQAYADKLKAENPDFKNSKNYIPYDISNDNFMMKVEGISFLKNTSTANSTTMFKLNGIQSPFNKTNLLAEVTGFQMLQLKDKKSVTLDAFQYVILFRNSKAGIPIE
jgi:hypothetical protein